MSNFKKPYKKAFFLLVSIVLTLGLSISLQSLLAAWTVPGASPPGSNVSPPVYNEHATPLTNALINMPLGVRGNLTLSGTGNIALGTNWLTGDGTDGEGIYIDSSGNVGIGANPPAQKLDVNGNVQATAFQYSSDRTLKKDIQPIANALDKINQLEGVDFAWKNSGEKSIGLIAQDVEKVFPELVHTNQNTGLKSLEYGNLVAPLIEAIKQQQKEIDELKSIVDRLKFNN